LPYVPEGASLEPEISLYEPPGALFAGPDGLDLIRRMVRLVAASASAPRSDGLGSRLLLALEIGDEQGAAVVDLMRAAGFGSVEILLDLAGRDRVVVGSA
jgi:release factor glutamine methyltransferase